MMHFKRTDQIGKWLSNRATFFGIAGICSLLLACILIVIQQTTILQFSLHLDPNRITHSEGHRYVYTVSPSRLSCVFVCVQSDTGSLPANSNLQMFEDGAHFGRAHNLHVNIAEIGAGRYSHWSTNLYFSTSDNSDPRTNGRDYSITANYAFSTWLIHAFTIFGLLTIAVCATRTNNGRGNWKSAHPELIWALIPATLAAFEFWLLLNANGQPTIVAHTDGGNISAWISGRIYPQRFATDFLLSDPSNTAFYESIFVAAVDALGRFTGDIGRAYLYLDFPIVCLQLVGFYFLGRVMTGSRLAGLVLVMMINVPIWIWGFNDLLGTYIVPLTRTAYEAVLPFLIMAFMAFAGRGRNIPFLFVLCGLSFYVHPVSAPAVSAGLLLACFSLRPVEEPFTRRLAYLFGGGLIFLAIAAPFAFSFLRSFSGGFTETFTDPQLATALEEFRKITGPMYYDALLAGRMLLADMSKAWPVWIIGFLGLMVLPIVDPEKRRVCTFLLLFLFGCIMASIGMCLVDQTIAKHLGRDPFQIDLIRGLRFVLLPLLLGFVLVLAKVEEIIRRRFRSPSAALATSIIAISVVYGWWSIYPHRVGSIAGLAQMPQWTQPASSDASAMMLALKERPVDGTILPIGIPTVGLAVRYAGLQPVAFIPNDANALFYSGSKARVKWHVLNELNQLLQKGQQPEASAALVQLLTESGAGYILLEDSVLDPTLELQIRQMAVVAERKGEWTLWKLNIR